MARAQPATILFPDDVDGTVRERNPAEYDWRFLAEGDSWFSFGSWKLHSLLNQMLFAKESAVVSIAQPGDTIRRMSEMTRKNSQLRDLLSHRHGFAWTAVLVSGGGNDVIDDAGRIIPPARRARPGDLPAEAYVDAQALRRSLRAIERAYTTIAELRDASDNPGAPILVHTYDLATPRNAPATFGPVLTLGPWLQPAMSAARIPEPRWNDVSDHILRALGTCLLGLETRLPNFHVAATQGTLTRAESGTSGDSNDWANEIHPNRIGFRKVARVVSAKLGRVLETLGVAS